MPDAGDARRRVSELLAAGALGEGADPGRVLEPLEVRDSEGSMHSWFCPVVAGGRLSGFAQLLPDLTVLRYSSFGRPTDAAAWVDPATVAARAATEARAGETLGEPLLSYDGSPERIAWRVEATAPDGGARTLWVAGDYVYAGSSSGEPTIGG